MSKKIEDSELQTLTLSPTNTNDDECSPFVNLASDETSFPISPPQSYSTVVSMGIFFFSTEREEVSEDEAQHHIKMRLIVSANGNEYQ